MRPIIALFLSGALIGILLATGVQIWREATYGTGPVATAAAPDGPVREIAFIANAVGGTVSLIDVSARQVVATLNIIPDGREVSIYRDFTQGLFGQRLIEQSGLNYAQDLDLSPDGRVLYVSRGHLGDVAAFDLETGDIMWRVPIGGVRADHMAISPDGQRLFVSALTDNTVEVIDTATARKAGAFVTGAFPHDNHVTKDGSRIYNASLGDMTVDVAERDSIDQATPSQGYAYQVTVADAASLEVLARHRFEAGIRPFAVTADETRLYAQLSNTHAVVAYDLEASDIIARLDLPVADGVTEDDWDFESPHHGLAMTGDETTLCVAGRASDYVGLVSVPDLSLITTIPVGDAPGWSALALDDSLCLVTNGRSDDVSLISMAERAELVRIPVGRGPKHITVGPVPVPVLDTLIATQENQP